MISLTRSTGSLTMSAITSSAKSRFLISITVWRLVLHEMIRRILPKGSSFDNLTQDDVNLMMNHINSYKRKKLNDRSPYEAFSFYYREVLLHQLGCSMVTAGNIILKPKLLKK